MADFLAEVTPFCGADDTLPVLTCVRLSATDRVLTAAATDRYCLGISTVQSDGPDFPEVLFPHADIKELTRICRGRSSRRSPGDPVRVTLDGDLLWLRFAFEGPNPLTVTYHTLGGEYPKLEPLLDKIATTELAVDRESIAFNPRLLSRFGAAQRTNVQPVRFRISGRQDGAYVTVGDHFRGAIMPVRTEP